MRKDIEIEVGEEEPVEVGVDSELEDETLPKGARTREQRKQIGMLLRRIVDANRDQVSGLRPRWEENQRLYDGGVYERAYRPHDDASSFSFPVLRSRVDMLCGNVCQSILGYDPYFIATHVNSQDESVQVSQDCVQWANEMARFPTKIRQLAVIAALTGYGAQRVTMEAVAEGFLADDPAPLAYNEHATPNKADYFGLRIDNIHPGDFVFYPTEAVEVPRARAVGHRFFLRRQEVRELIAAKRYIDEPGLADELAEGDTNEDSVARTETFARDTKNASSGVDGDDDQIEIYCLYVKLDLEKSGIESWYEIEFGYQNSRVLSISKWNMRRPPYFIHAFHHEYGVMHRNDSIGTQLQMQNKGVNECLGLAYDCIMQAGTPVVFYNKNGGGFGDQYIEMKPGRAIGTDGDPQVTQIQVRADVQPLITMAQMFMTMADTQVRTSPATAAQPLKSGTTATEAGIIQAGAASAQNDYLSIFAGAEMCAQMDYVRELLYRNFDHVKATHPSLPAESAEQLRKSMRWEVNGKTASRTTAAQLQALQLLAQFAATTPAGAAIKWDKWLRVVAETAELRNPEQVIKSEEEMLQEQVLMMQQAGGVNELSQPTGVEPSESGALDGGVGVDQRLLQQEAGSGASGALGMFGG